MAREKTSLGGGGGGWTTNKLDPYMVSSPESNPRSNSNAKDQDEEWVQFPPRKRA